MIQWLVHLLAEANEGWGFLRLFDYLSFRAVMASMTTFGFSLIIGRPMIRMLHRNGIRDVVEDYGVIDIRAKRGTPTMGGLIIIFSFMVGYLLCGFVLNLSGEYDHDRLTMIGDLGVTLLLFTIGLLRLQLEQ